MPHAFWNATDAPARVLIISPAGFERFFAEISPLLSPTHPSPPDEQALGAVMAKYGLEMGFGTIPMLFERHGFVPGGPPA